MKRAIVIALSAVGLSAGILLGTAAPALADSNWAYPVYDQQGNYAGCISKLTGAYFSPSEITELGCNTDIPLAE